MKPSTSSTLIVLCLFLTGSAFVIDDGPEIKGSWIRKADHLRIEVKEQDSNSLYSFIKEDGDEEFPCEVSDLPIYKNIVRIGRNSWRCDFLVVTMGSCRTDYEQGQIYLTKKDELEIICPGFEKKIYSRVTPRYERGS